MGPPRRDLRSRTGQVAGRLAILAALLVIGSSARADDDDSPVIRKRGVFHEIDGELTLTVGFRELFSTAMRKRLDSGFATTVVMRIYTFDREGTTTVAYSARTLRAVYDLWEERYLLSIDEPERTRRVKKQRRQDVVDRLTSLWRVPVAPLASIQRGREYFVAIVVEVNPISEDLLSEVRRWLRHPQSSRQQVSSESIFGSFVSIFVNNTVRRAEKTLRLRTQLVYRRP